MDFLHFLADLRTPWLNAVMLAVTECGGEMVLIATAMVLFWCVNKYLGYYMLSVGFVGIQINQLGKVLFRIERPWVRDPSFEAIEAAKPAAEGYSFPSGHTQNAVGTFGSTALWTKKTWLRIALIVLAVLVSFSRMYLGVHTPADVLASFVIGSVLVLALYPVFKKQEPRAIRVLLIVMLLWSVGQILFMHFFPFPANADGAELYSGLENAWKITGALLGFTIAFEIDQRYIRFETHAVWWAQLLKLSIGFALALGVKELGYLVFDFIGLLPLTKAIGYLMMTLFVGCIWPLTFRWFAKLGGKK